MSQMRKPILLKEIAKVILICKAYKGGSSTTTQKLRSTSKGRHMKMQEYLVPVVPKTSYHQALT